ncbi:MAG TPA: DUF1326 domain-containing protein [Candidatus Polarisedimenticolia bacterium]|nr:DUF1326 domain-containing protein [Candidatus Polarisedimenticolia bacterium]
MKSLFACVLLIGVSGALPLLGAEAQKTEAKKTPWKIVGQLEEACSCNAACPCWFGSKPTKMTCSGGQFIFIEKGSYGSVALDGLALGGMVQSPEGEGMMDSYGKWKFNYFYLDEKANPAQREALRAIAEVVLMGDASPNRELRYVPLTRVIQGDEHKISLGQYGSFSGHLVEGGLGGPSRIINPPGADPLHHEYAQGKTKNLTYTDAGQTWSFSDSNYMHGTFEIDSAQYEKYVAGLAQKMQGMKK